jgi:hypothetical protein
MYGPDYVKLSRVSAVQLFSMFIAHYAALPPARSDPRWSLSPQPCDQRLHSPRPYPADPDFPDTQALQHPPTARDSNLGSANHDMSRASAFVHPIPGRRAHPRPCRYTPTYAWCLLPTPNDDSQLPTPNLAGILGVVPSSLEPATTYYNILATPISSLDLSHEALITCWGMGLVAVL